MNTKIPDFLLEMSQQMAEQDNRYTSHPFWQVRCKEYVVTEEGYNDHHWLLCNDEGEFFSSHIDGCVNTALLENYPEFCKSWENKNSESFLEEFDIDSDSLPSDVRRIYMQEIEEVVSTHLTQHDAEWLIKRKQHDFPPLYTYVESAYWSPQLKQLQDWIISLTTNEVKNTICENETLKAENERLQKSHERYEKLRKLNARQFQGLYLANIQGAGRFDDLVDALV